MTGLTNEQVQERIAEGKVNVNENPNTYHTNYCCDNYRCNHNAHCGNHHNPSCANFSFFHA